MSRGGRHTPKNINLGSTNAHGFEMVASVIDANKTKFSYQNIRLSQYSGDPAELPAADSAGD